MDGAVSISPAGYLVLVWLGADRGVCDTQTLRISAAFFFCFLLCLCRGACRRKENKLMDSLLNVIRAIIDMLPGRCKTINSSLALWYLPSTPQSASRRQLRPDWSAREKKRPQGVPGSPRSLCLSC